MSGLTADRGAARANTALLGLSTLLSLVFFALGLVGLRDATRTLDAPGVEMPGLEEQLASELETPRTWTHEEVLALARLADDERDLMRDTARWMVSLSRLLTYAQGLLGLLLGALLLRVQRVGRPLRH